MVEQVIVYHTCGTIELRGNRGSGDKALRRWDMAWTDRERGNNDHEAEAPVALKAINVTK